MQLSHLTPVEAAAAVIAFLIQFSKIAEASKGFWSRIPPKWQWIPSTALVAAAELEKLLAGQITSWTDFIVPFLYVGALFVPGASSAADTSTLKLARSMADKADDPDLAHDRIDLARYGKPFKAARLVGMTLMLCTLGLFGCSGTVAKDVQTALTWIAKVTEYTNDAAAFLSQHEDKIVAMAPGSIRDGLQADLDKALADYRVAVGLTGDGAAVTEDALAKNWAAFAADAEKLAADAAAAGLFKAPGVASSNAVPAGASPPPPPQDDTPPLPLIVRHLKGQV